MQLPLTPEQVRQLCEKLGFAPIIKPEMSQKERVSIHNHRQYLRRKALKQQGVSARENKKAAREGRH